MPNDWENIAGEGEFVKLQNIAYERRLLNSKSIVKNYNNFFWNPTNKTPSINDRKEKEDIQGNFNALEYNNDTVTRGGSSEPI